MIDPRVCELEATVERLTREVDALRTEVTKAQEAMGNGADDARWRPGESAVDALIRKRGQAQRWHTALVPAYIEAGQMWGKLKQECDALRVENAQLRRVVEAARALLDALPRCGWWGCDKPAICGYISREPRWCREHQQYDRDDRDSYADEVEALAAALDAAEVKS